MTDIIKLNIGGIKYQTSYNTIGKDDESMLSSMFSGRHNIKTDSEGYYFIDRNGEVFKYILKYLRDGKINFSDMTNDTKNDLLDEANYYNLTGLINYINEYNRDINLEYYLFNIYNVNIREFEYEFNLVFSIEIVKKIGYLAYRKKKFLDLQHKKEPSCLCLIFDTVYDIAGIKAEYYDIEYQTEFINIYNFYMKYQNNFIQLIKLNNDETNLLKTPYKNMNFSLINGTSICGILTFNIKH